MPYFSFSLLTHNPKASWISCFFVVLLVAAGSCGASEPPGTSLTPVSAEVEAALSALLSLQDGDAERRALRAEHRNWQAFRASHCYALAATADPAQRDTCEAGMDRTRLEQLRRLQLSKLLNLPRLPPVGIATPNFELVRADRLKGRRLVTEFSGNGRLAAVGWSDGNLEVYDLTSSARLFFGKVFDSYATNLHFSDNSHVLAVMSRSHRGLLLLNAVSGERLVFIDRIQSPAALVDGGRKVLWVREKQLLLTDLLTDGDISQPFAGKGYGALRLSVSPSGHLAVLMHHDGKLESWAIRNDGELVHITNNESVSIKSGVSTERATDGTFSSDGTAFFTLSSDGNIDRWSVPELKPLGRIGLSRRPYGRLASVAGNLLAIQLREGSSVPTLFIYDPSRGLASHETLPGSYIGIGSPGAGLLIGSNRRIASRGMPQLNEPLPMASPSVETVTATRASVDGGKTDKRLDIDAGAHVEAVGVYQGSYPNGRASRPGHPEGQVDVSIGKTDGSLILVLSSYEPVNWRLNVSSQARLRYVLLSGNYPSKVTGAGDARIIRIGSTSAYKRPSSSYAALDREVKEYVGKNIKIFQGGYNGAEFSVGSGN